MNIIVIIADTFRADHLGCYGNSWIKTPNLDQLAKKSVVFTNCYADGLPTIPARRVYFTGKSILLPLNVRRWRLLYNKDVTLSEVLSSHSFTTGFVTDTYHYFKPGMNFHRGFDSWQWIRGQEFDRWQSGPKDKFNPKKHIPKHLWTEDYDNNTRQYMMNTQDRRGEKDYFCARSCRAAMRWLERNTKNKPFMLWLDMFDPHEPWDAPERFQEMYYENYPCQRFLFGYGVNHEAVREDDLPAIKAAYAAEVTFSDFWIGRLLEKIKDLGLMDDTIIVFSSDHGTHLGEEGCVHKTPTLLNSCVAQLPLIVRYPDTSFANKKIDALVSAIDFMPTFLSMLGIEGPSDMDGEDFWKLAQGKRDGLRERTFIGWNTTVGVRDKSWHYFLTINSPKARFPDKGPYLYDLLNDPKETKNLVKEHSEVVERMKSYIEERFKITLSED